MEIIMSKYLVLVIFVFSILLSKVYLDAKKQKSLSNGSRLNVNDESLISKNIYMNGNFDFIDRTDNKREEENFEKDKSKSIQKEEGIEKENKKIKRMNKDKSVEDEKEEREYDAYWWIFGD
jgi:hypothetical protein